MGLRLVVRGAGTRAQGFVKDEMWRIRSGGMERTAWVRDGMVGIERSGKGRSGIERGLSAPGDLQRGQGISPLSSPDLLTFCVNSLSSF